MLEKSTMDGKRPFSPTKFAVTLFQLVLLIVGWLYICHQECVDCSIYIIFRFNCVDVRQLFSLLIIMNPELSVNSVALLIISLLNTTQPKKSLRW